MVNFCSNCGAKFASEMKFCTSCGVQAAEIMRIQEENGLRKAEEKRHASALIEQARIQKEEQVRLRERKKRQEQTRQKLRSTLKKPWFLSTIGLVSVTLVVSAAMVYTSSTSWSTRVKLCDSVMNKERVTEDSYELNSSQDELLLFTLDRPQASQWVDCVGGNLADGSPDKTLSETLYTISFVGENVIYGNLNIYTEKLGDLYQIRISRNS
jgi:hypothetical protein